MDGYSSKRSVGRIAAPKKRSVTALKDTDGSQDGSAQFCSRIGCCGRLNNPKGTKNKSLEKPKPLKPSLRPSSTTSSSKNCSSVTNVKRTLVESEKKSSSKIERIPKESRSVSAEPEVQVLNPSRSHTQSKLKSKSSIADQNSESNNGRRKRFTQGENSSSGKGKKIIGVSPYEGRVSDPRNSRTLTASRKNGVSSVRTQRSLNQPQGDDFSLVKSTDVIPEMPQTQEPSVNGGGSTSDTSSTTSSTNSTERSIVRFVNDHGTRHYNIDGIADVTSLTLSISILFLWVFKG